MSQRLYVSNLAKQVTPDSLRELFSDEGFEAASIEILRPRRGEVRRRYALVELPDLVDLEEAVRVLDGLDLEGVCLRVEPAGEEVPEGARALDEDGPTEEDRIELERRVHPRRERGRGDDRD